MGWEISKGRIEMIIIHCKNNHCLDRAYIYDVILHDFWKISYAIRYEEREDIALEVNGTFLRMADTFFQHGEEKWLSEDSMPKRPLIHMKIPSSFCGIMGREDIPIIYGDSHENVIYNPSDTYFPIDMFGSAFFMMTRYEEIIASVQDQYGRFPSQESLACQEGFLERPIINEYLEMFWTWLKWHWPRIKRHERKFFIMPTHDVDRPFFSMHPEWYTKYRILVGDIIKRHDVAGFRKHLKLYWNARQGNYESDPNNTFEQIMDIDEKNGRISNFYFMTSRGRNLMDGNYDIFHPAIKLLVHKVLQHGHCIGIHPGFGSYLSEKYIRQDVNRLRNLIENENLGVSQFGGRQHYLQWKAPITWGYYEKLHLLYDATLCFADHIGFRCGICYDYPVYNVIEHERYHLREYPLEVMECSGFAEEYMNLGYGEMLERCLILKEKVKKFQGVFVVLWHNHEFIDEEKRRIYEEIIG